MNEIFKQVRPGLFYVEYVDFDFDKAAEMTNERYRPKGLMCSGIRKGDYIGRNADVYAGFDTVLVMHLSHKCARYSSIGIVSDYFIPTPVTGWSPTTSTEEIIRLTVEHIIQEEQL